MTELVEKFLREECGWASETDKDVIRASIADSIRHDGEPLEDILTTFRTDMEAFKGHERSFISGLSKFLKWRNSHTELDEALSRAIDQQDLDLACALVGQGVSMNSGYWDDGFFIVNIANSLLDSALWIIDHARELKADLDRQDIYDWTDEHLPGFRERVAVHLDIEDRLGWQRGPILRNTPLILANKKGWDHIDTQYDPAERERPPPRMGQVIAALLEAGVDPNIQDGCGNTALHIALLHREIRAVRLLLKHGARLDLPNNAGLLPEDMLKVRYTDIDPFLYQQTGNDVNDYIHTLKDYNSWRKAGPALRRVLAAHKAAAKALNPANPPQCAAGFAGPSCP